ncbi:MAG: hypothetical protein WD802_06730 [Gemmatimonadaceae bacterium]
MNRNYSITSAVVFALVALMQAWRFVLDFPVQMGAWSVPRTLSGVIAVAAAFLAVWGLRAARLGKSERVVAT